MSLAAYEVEKLFPRSFQYITRNIYKDPEYARVLRPKQQYLNHCETALTYLPEDIQMLYKKWLCGFIADESDLLKQAELLDEHYVTFY